MAEARATQKKSVKNELHVSGDPSKSQERRLADVTLEPAASGVATVLAFAKGVFGENDLTSVYQAIRDQIGAVAKGDMGHPEALLVAQVNSLNMIFTELARRSALNMGEYIEASERYMRLALKAQAQCRATVETLAALKNPPIVYARQANISAGHQQINNHPTSPSAPAGNAEGLPNELLEDERGRRIELDCRAASAAAGCNPEMEAVGEVDRTADGRWEAPQQSKR